MKLYQGNAKDLVGRKIDCKVRRFGHYLITVIEISGELYVKDMVGAYMPTPEKETDLSYHWFDFIIDWIL